MKALIVDDSSVIRKIIRSAVQTLGLDYLEARNSSEAMDLLNREDEIGIITMDWNMRGKNGLECIKDIKADERLRHIPIMMITTENNKNNIIEALRAGAVHYLVKPFTVEELLKRVMECFGRGSEPKKDISADGVKNASGKGKDSI